MNTNDTPIPSSPAQAEASDPVAGRCAVASGSPFRKLLDEVDAVIWGDARPTTYEPDRALALRTLLKLRDDHADKLAAQLAECAGYLASVRTDRTDATNSADGTVYALQTLEWAEGAVEIAERANEALEAHDDLRALQANATAQPRADKE